MKALIKLFLIIVIPITGNAQKPPIKFGDVSIEDLKMNQYEKDSSASALVLADYGESILQYDQNNGFVLHFERLTRIKILTKDGLEKGNFRIPLYHDAGNDEKISGLKAVTYNLENGKIVESKLKGDGIFKEAFDANLDFTKVTLPNVRVGSVVEITYNVLSDFLFNFQDWEFQTTVPTVWSEYRARIPEYFNYDKYMQGYISLDVNESTINPNSITITTKERGDGRTTKTEFTNEKIDFMESRFRWAAKDVPAFKPEPFITSARDFSSKMNFELATIQFPNQPVKKYMGSWEDINKQFSESEEFGLQVSGNGFLKKAVDEMLAGIIEPEERIKTIVNYVKQNVEWDEVSRKYTSKSLRKVVEDKKGNSAEINLLLASMLDKAGITAYPLLLSTRDHGFVREETPISSQFNYVVCMAMVGEKSFLLDATERLLPSGVLPERCLNGKGFVISKEGYKWLPLQSTTKSKVVVNAELEITQELELSGKLQIDRGGYDGLAGRKRYFSNDEAEYVKNFVGSKSWEISKAEITNTKEIQQPLRETYELIMRDQMTSAGNQIYINPLFLYRIEENPFKLENRQYPVDFSSPFERIYMCRIKIPAEYRVDELPRQKVLALPSNAGKYTYSVTQAGDILIVVSNFQINRSIFDQSEYPNLREFYSQVVAKQSEQIVLVKK